MTETKTTVRKPRATKAKVEEVEVLDAIKAEVKTTIETVKKATEKNLNDSDKIAVMNNTTGRYAYRSKSGYAFDLEEYGDIAYVPFSELRTMYSSQKRHILEAFIIILNEDVIDELNLNKEYKTILTTSQVEELLTNSEAVKEALPKMIRTMQEVILVIAKRKYKNDELTDTRVIKAIKEATNVDITED